MRYVGVDVHLRQSTICVLDQRGRKVLSRTVRGQFSAVIDELRNIGGPMSVCFEASTGYGIHYERLHNVARRVVVAHPGQLRLIFRSKRKNDRVDAEKLAKLLFLDEVPTVHVHSSEVRSWRRLINHRHTLVSERVRVRNNLRAMLRTHGIDAKGLWRPKGLSWLESVELPSEMDAVQRDLPKARRRIEWGRLENGFMARLRGGAEWMFGTPSSKALRLDTGLLHGRLRNWGGLQRTQEDWRGLR